jgi:biofilm protein TabA
MILDNYKNINLYIYLHPNFKKAFDFIRTYQSGSLDDGRYDILGDDVFALISKVQEYQPSTKLEAHQKYIDIQFIVKGKDKIGWKNLEDCSQPLDCFNIENDYILFNDKPLFHLTLNQGSFVIFYPDDAHGPLMGNTSMEKIVIKVNIEQ